MLIRVPCQVDMARQEHEGGSDSLVFASHIPLSPVLAPTLTLIGGEIFDVMHKGSRSSRVERFAHAKPSRFKVTLWMDLLTLATFKSRVVKR